MKWAGVNVPANQILLVRTATSAPKAITTFQTVYLATATFPVASILSVMPMVVNVNVTTSSVEGDAMSVKMDTTIFPAALVS